MTGVERPGVGDSPDHRYRNFREWADDVEVVVDELGHDRFAVVGLSGGGPYALACAAGLPDRVTAVGLLGSVCPLLGPDADRAPRRGDQPQLSDQLSRDLRGQSRHPAIGDSGSSGQDPRPTTTLPGPSPIASKPFPLTMHEAVILQRDK